MYRKFHTQCFWSFDPAYLITSPEHHMKRLLAAALLLCAACSGPQVAFNPKFKDVKHRRVALAGFEGPAGEAASDILAHELLGSGADVVERGRLQSVLNEQRLGASGALDPASVRKVGRLLGVDALMLGSVTQYAQPQSFLVTGTSSAAFVAIDGDTLTCQPPASEARQFAGLIIKEGDP